MKLITFQSMEALKSLIKNGELVCDEKYIDKEKYGFVYDWISNKMSEKINNKSSSKYPLWCFVKCYNGICPPKHKGKFIDDFQVKITFYKDKKDVFITDYRRYSFLLNNKYIPKSIDDMNKFDLKINREGMTKENRDMIIKSFDRCITEDSNILQGCVWNIKLSEVSKIEILHDDGYVYGSLNYIRSNGKRIDWIEDFYKIISDN